MYRVLIVEDLEESRLIVKRALANASMSLTFAGTLKEALDLIKSEPTPPFDLVILDQGLPDGDGFTVLEVLRNIPGAQVPVFLLTSDQELDSKVTAFNLGADDYLTKPISGIELRARVEMRLKKSAGQSMRQNVIKKGGLTLDTTLMRTTLQEGSEAKIAPLTAKEFKILALLVRNEGTVFSRPELVRNIWGEGVDILERTVDSHIFGLRKKLGSYANNVECVPGEGYRFISPAGPVLGQFKTSTDFVELDS